jgi:hypothetical protein
MDQLLAFYEEGTAKSLYQSRLRSTEIPGDPLWCVPTHPARTLDLDLGRADIQKDTADGKLDFRSLRVTPRPPVG